MSKWQTLSRGKKIGVVVGGLFLISVAGGSSQKSQTPTPVAANQNVNQASTVDVSKQQTIDTVETKTESKTEVVSYESVTQNDSTLASGTTKVSVAGVNGERTITYSVTYKNGVETSRSESSNQVTKQPVTAVTKVGTKQAVQQSCPNGTYINSAGNEVCSPYSASSAPAGATARCGDGTYSFSQSRSGTCSHHSGVSAWL